jgi:hypothetical protein
MHWRMSSAACPPLFGKWVGDEGLVHDAQIGLALGDQLVRPDGVDDSSRDDHWHIDNLTDAAERSA